MLFEFLWHSIEFVFLLFVLGVVCLCAGFVIWVIKEFIVFF